MQYRNESKNNKRKYGRPRIYVRVVKRVKLEVKDSVRKKKRIDLI